MELNIYQMDEWDIFGEKIGNFIAKIIVMDLWSSTEREE